MAFLPIPYFNAIEETYRINAAEAVLICPDPMAGRPSVYSVIRADLSKGGMACIGRELDLLTARACARRPKERGGKPLSESELVTGKERW